MADLGKHIGKEEILAKLQELKDQLAEGNIFGEEELLAKVEELDELLSFFGTDAEFIRSDWFYGGFCEFLVDSMGSPNQGWPYDYIDWDKAAEVLSLDYRQVTILGDTYYVRS